MAASREYVELIFQNSGLYPSFEPSRIVEVGDYGTIDKATGRFISEGNIFDNQASNGTRSLGGSLGIEVVDNTGPVFHRYASKGVTVREANPSVDLDMSALPGIGAGAKAGFDISFNKGGAAMLLFPHGSFQSMRHEGRLASANDKTLASKAIVTSVWTAPTFAFCMSRRRESSFSVSLGAEVPTPVAGLSAGGGITTTFKTIDSGDCLQLGPPFNPSADFAQPHKFHPLFRLSIARSPRMTISLWPRTKSTPRRTTTGTPLEYSVEEVDDNVLTPLATRSSSDVDDNASDEGLRSARSIPTRPSAVDTDDEILPIFPFPCSDEDEDDFQFDDDYEGYLSSVLFP